MDGSLEGPLLQPRSSWPSELLAIATFLQVTLYFIILYCACMLINASLVVKTCHFSWIIIKFLTHAHTMDTRFFFPPTQSLGRGGWNRKRLSHDLQCVVGCVAAKLQGCFFHPAHFLQAILDDLIALVGCNSHAAQCSYCMIPWPTISDFRCDKTMEGPLWVPQPNL